MGLAKPHEHHFASLIDLRQRHCPNLRQRLHRFARRLHDPRNGIPLRKHSTQPRRQQQIPNLDVRIAR
jgi:hypothetical protein